MKDAIKQWGGNLKIDPEGLMDLERAVDRLPMFSDEPLPINDEESVELRNIVHLSAEDYADNFVLPSYGVIHTSNTISTWRVFRSVFQS